MPSATIQNSWMKAPGRIGMTTRTPAMMPRMPMKRLSSPARMAFRLSSR